jgi:uncharacterized membrane protein
MSVELIIATFEKSENQAGEVLESVKRLQKDGALELEDAAVIVKRKDGEVEIEDVGDVDSKHGAVFGAVTGAVIGLIGGPIGAVVGAAAGAATGSVSAKLADYGVSNKMIEDIEKGLQPGSSAIIAYVKLTWVNKAVTELEKAGATVAHETMSGDALGLA